MRKIMGAIAGMLSLGACVVEPPPSYLVAATDPALSAPRIRASAVTASVKAFNVRGPANWQELNRRAGPQGGAGGMNHPMTPGTTMEKEGRSKAPATSGAGMDHSNMPGMK